MTPAQRQRRWNALQHKVHYRDGDVGLPICHVETGHRFSARHSEVTCRMCRQRLGLPALDTEQNSGAQSAPSL